MKKGFIFNIIKIFILFSLLFVQVVKADVTTLLSLSLSSVNQLGESTPLNQSNVQVKIEIYHLDAGSTSYTEGSQVHQQVSHSDVNAGVARVELETKVSHFLHENVWMVVSVWNTDIIAWETFDAVRIHAVPYSVLSHYSLEAESIRWNEDTFPTLNRMLVSTNALWVASPNFSSGGGSASGVVLGDRSVLSDYLMDYSVTEMKIATDAVGLRALSTNVTLQNLSGYEQLGFLATQNRLDASLIDGSIPVHQISGINFGASAVLLDHSVENRHLKSKVENGYSGISFNKKINYHTLPLSLRRLVSMNLLTPSDWTSDEGKINLGDVSQLFVTPNGTTTNQLDAQRYIYFNPGVRLISANSVDFQSQSIPFSAVDFVHSNTNQVNSVIPFSAINMGGASLASKLEDFSISADKLQRGGFDTTFFQIGSLDASVLQSQSIKHQHLDTYIVHEDSISDNAIVSRHISFSFTSEQFADGAVDSRIIKDTSILGSDIADNVIGGSKLSAVLFSRGAVKLEGSRAYLDVKLDPVGGITKNASHELKIEASTAFSQLFPALKDGTISDGILPYFKRDENTFAASNIYYSEVGDNKEISIGIGDPTSKFFVYGGAYFMKDAVFSGFATFENIWINKGVTLNTGVVAVIPEIQGRVNNGFTLYARTIDDSHPSERYLAYSVSYNESIINNNKTRLGFRGEVTDNNFMTIFHGDTYVAGALTADLISQNLMSVQYFNANNIVVPEAAGVHVTFNADTYISSNLGVLGMVFVTGSSFVSGSFDVQGKAFFHDTTTANNLVVTHDLSVSHIRGSTYPDLLFIEPMVSMDKVLTVNEGIYSYQYFSTTSTNGLQFYAGDTMDLPAIYVSDNGRIAMGRGSYPSYSELMLNEVKLLPTPQLFVSGDVAISGNIAFSKGLTANEQSFFLGGLDVYESLLVSGSMMRIVSDDFTLFSAFISAPNDVENRAIGIGIATPNMMATFPGYPYILEVSGNTHLSGNVLIDSTSTLNTTHIAGLRTINVSEEGLHIVSGDHHLLRFRMVELDNPPRQYPQVFMGVHDLNKTKQFTDKQVIPTATLFVSGDVRVLGTLHADKEITDAFGTFFEYAYTEHFEVVPSDDILTGTPIFYATMTKNVSGASGGKVGINTKDPEFSFDVHADSAFREAVTINFLGVSTSMIVTQDVTVNSIVYASNFRSTSDTGLRLFGYDRTTPSILISSNGVVALGLMKDEWLTTYNKYQFVVGGDTRVLGSLDTDSLSVSNDLLVSRNLTVNSTVYASRYRAVSDDIGFLMYATEDTPNVSFLVSSNGHVGIGYGVTYNAGSGVDRFNLYVSGNTGVEGHGKTAMYVTGGMQIDYVTAS
ncbi:MAG: hypothetical protein VW378_00300, partial [bacterium]